MPVIPYRATNFSGAFAQLNGNAQINVTWAQLVWAAITVGKAAGDEYAYGIYSALERLHRASMMRAYLREASSGHLLRTIPYEASDPSEKTSISFYLGLTLAKLFGDVLFAVPRMLHVAVYAQNYQIAPGQGASRPDLIGLSANDDWFVFEAKGRSNGFDSEALGTAKDQAEQITSIDNVTPLCRIASQSFFSQHKKINTSGIGDQQGWSVQTEVKLVQRLIIFGHSHMGDSDTMPKAKIWRRLSEDYRPLKTKASDIGQALSREQLRHLAKVAAKRRDWEAAFYGSVLAANTGLRGGEIKKTRIGSLDLARCRLENPARGREIRRERTLDRAKCRRNRGGCPLAVAGARAWCDGTRTLPDAQTPFPRQIWRAQG